MHKIQDNKSSGVTKIKQQSSFLFVPQSDRLTSHFILPLRLWIMEIMAEFLFSSSSFSFSFCSSWLFCCSRDEAWKPYQLTQPVNPSLNKHNHINPSDSSQTLMLASFLACSVLLSSFLRRSTVSSRSVLSCSFSFSFFSSALSSPRRPGETRRMFTEQDFFLINKHQ